jgi:Glycosyl transferase family 2/SEC-C motif
MPQDSDITVVITSCNRHDLLARTLESFRAHETEKRVARILVAEDGDADPGPVCARFGAEHFRSGERVGQIKLIDQAYARITTPYIFHLEDDWEFYRSGFMERSRQLLDADPKTLMVWLRAWNDTNGWPLSFRAPDGSWGQMAFGYQGVWYGFAFNPGLRRLSDYRLLGNYAGQTLTLGVQPRVPSAALPYEAQAGHFYRQLGYRALILNETGFVRHIGEARHVTHPDDAKSVPANIPRNHHCYCGSGRKYKHCHGALV